ncbi:hypothetical protein BCR43DRAFT_481714 [Syncephalastrum racemosum]|uniref:RING-type domain-containing protein n=1 Tax=Syncephalastrum racemosum TaxID=13706 RepID=A0A1X2HSJ6_SYNRA|nr:hypothetical protein BCR43DRAFT_481714 [Syncephalastrum racemosum]
MPACPICLSEDPLAARVSRCGHVFCLPCILHYFDLAEENTRIRACPVCGDAITAAEDLKLVKKTEHHVAVRLQEPVNLVLMHRPAGSMFAMPTTAKALPQQDGFIPTDRTPMALTYARFMLASPDYMTAEYTQNASELTEAMTQLSLPEDNEELVSITSGLKHIEIERAQPPLMKRRRPGRNDINGDRRDLGGVDYYYFQAADGQLVFLHPQQIRILRHEFGDYRFFPERLISKVTYMEDRTLDEVYRKRYKYLGHLPVGSGVTFVKVDLSGTVSEEVLAAFPEANDMPHEEKDDTVVKDDEADEDEIYALSRRSSSDDERVMSRDESFAGTRTTNIEEMDEDELLAYVMRLSEAEQ